MDIVSDIGSAAKGAIGLAKHAKAKLIVVEKDGKKNPPEHPDDIEFMFNPTEYKLSQTAKVNRAEIASKNGGDPQFQSTSPVTLSMQLFLDDFASIRGNVTERITRLLEWQRPTKYSIDKLKKPAPPYVGFQWGNKEQLGNFKGLLTSVAVTYKVFRRDGTPLQATVDITIEGDVELPPGTNPTSHAIDTHRIRTTIERESLQSIAYSELGRPTYWRAIAELNGIDDPLRVKAGAALVLPSIADAARRG